MADGPTEITALTLNCWGLKYISDLRNERLAEIGRRLAELASPPPVAAAAPSQPQPPLDIVALQECWCYEDFAAIHSLTRHVLPHARFFHSGVWGAGLAVLARWPITQTSMRSYPLNGRPTAFWRGDWFVGKGLASATLRVSDHCAVDVLVTHTHAPYEAGEPGDSYHLHRLAQSWEVGRRMRAAAERGRLVLAMGDFNMTPDSLQYKALFLGAAPTGSTSDSTGLVTTTTAAATSPILLNDTWRELHPDASLGPADLPAEQARQRPVPSAAFNLAVNGATSDNVYNTWRWPKDKQKRLHKTYRQRYPVRRQQQQQQQQDEALAPLPHDGEFAVEPDTPDPRGKRLDYIFYACPPASSAWRTKTARVGMVAPHPTLGCSVSDHFSVEVTLERVPAGGQAAAAAAAEPKRGTPATATAPALALYDTILTATEAYMARERAQRHWRAVHFFAAVAVTIGCYVAVWFSPRPFVAFLLMLLASLGLAAGVVDGLLALLFFGSEIRTLKEFYWEVCNSRAAIAPAGATAPYAEDKAYVGL